MAVTKICGVTVRSGNYENKPWKNLYISTKLIDKDDKGTIGEFCENHKVQFKKVNDVLSLGLSPVDVDKLEADDFQNLIGKTVRLCFDKYHNLDYVIFIPDNTPPKTDNKA